MILHEANDLGFEIKNQIIDLKDSYGLSPLYLLCEEGFKTLPKNLTGKENTKASDELFKNYDSYVDESKALDINFI